MDYISELIPIYKKNRKLNTLFFLVTTTLQQILGPGKDGNLFSLHSTPENPDDLHVYFGLAYLEKVKKSTDSFQYKYLLGRLYNAGYKRKVLKETFGHAIGTLRSWGNALLTGDIDIILSAFSGQGDKIKVTEEVENFIKSEYRKIYPDNKYTYSKQIISGVKEVFNVTVSSETVHKILKSEKNIGNKNNALEASSSEAETETDICKCPVNSSSKNTNKRNNSLPLLKSEEELEGSYIHHPGIVLAFWLYKELKVEDKMIEQWLSLVLLGKVNLEQTESLNFDSLDFLHGFNLLRKAKSHHAVLRHMSKKQDNIDKLLHLNSCFVSGKNCSYVYYDPHSVKYTGMKNILKGWCGSAGKITKVNYQDFFHSSTGYPLYFEILRCKNHSADAKTWRVKYYKDVSYSKIQGFYRLIVKIKPPKDKKECEVSILTNGRIDDKTAVFAMLNRWVQENDFRYMVINFGLNQITSYRSVKYDLTEELLAEKKVMSESYKLMCKAIDKKEKEFSQLLVMAAEKSKDKKIEMNDEILNLKTELHKLRKEKRNMEAYENKLDRMINTETEKLFTNKKYMFDTVKITVRNIFYRLMEIFRPLYNNFRNDHTILREILRSDGYIHSENDIIYISLEIKKKLDKKQSKSIEKFTKIIESKINSLAVFAKEIRMSIKNSAIGGKKRAFNLRFS